MQSPVKEERRRERMKEGKREWSKRKRWWGVNAEPREGGEEESG